LQGRDTEQDHNSMLLETLPCFIDTLLHNVHWSHELTGTSLRPLDQLVFLDPLDWGLERPLTLLDENEREVILSKSKRKVALDADVFGWDLLEADVPGRCQVDYPCELYRDHLCYVRVSEIAYFIFFH
jgi:hypothetical protein